MHPAAAHSLSVEHGQFARLRGEKCFLRRTSPRGPSLAPLGQFTLCRRRKRISMSSRLRARTLRGFFDTLTGHESSCPVSFSPGDRIQTCVIRLPNNPKKLFPVVSNGFYPFPLVFIYSLDLFEPAFSRCSSAVCGHLCGQKRFPPQTCDFSPAQDGKRFVF